MRRWFLVVGLRFSILAAATIAPFGAGCRSSVPAVSSDPPFENFVATNPYRLQTGDLLGAYSIEPRFPDPAEPHGFRIKQDGTVTLPSLGTFVAAGKTLKELREEIVERDARFLNVVLMLSCCEPFYPVRGEVKSPGPQLHWVRTTVAEAIQAAGSFTSAANTNIVRIVRASGRRETFRMEGAHLDPNQNNYISSGDLILIKRRGPFSSWP